MKQHFLILTRFFAKIVFLSLAIFSVSQAQSQPINKVPSNENNLGSLLNEYDRLNSKNVSFEGFGDVLNHLSEVENARMPVFNEQSIKISSEIKPDLSKARPWKNIIADPRFKELSPVEQAEVKKMYFDYWIAPYAIADGMNIEEVRAEFWRQIEAKAADDQRITQPDTVNIKGNVTSPSGMNSVIPVSTQKRLVLAFAHGLIVVLLVAIWISWHRIMAFVAIQSDEYKKILIEAISPLKRTFIVSINRSKEILIASINYAKEKPERIFLGIIAFSVLAIAVRVWIEPTFKLHRR